MFCQKFLENPRQDHKLPADPDLTLIPRHVNTIALEHEEYTLSTQISLNIGPLNKEQGLAFQKLLEEFADLFATDITELGQTDLVTHQIYTEDVHPICSCSYSVPPNEQEFIQTELQKMLEHKLIQTSDSSWASSVVLVRKKNGKLRFCVDYRKLNAITKKDAYPLPCIDKMLNALSGCSWFSTLDLASGYWQVAMDL